MLEPNTPSVTKPTDYPTDPNEATTDLMVKTSWSNVISTKLNRDVVPTKLVTKIRNLESAHVNTFVQLRPVHVKAQSILSLRLGSTVFETGIKVIDLLSPYRYGGKIGLFGGAGVGKTVLIMELIIDLGT